MRHFCPDRRRRTRPSGLEMLSAYAACRDALSVFLVLAFFLMLAASSATCGAIFLQGCIGGCRRANQKARV